MENSFNENGLLKIINENSNHFLQSVGIFIILEN